MPESFTVVAALVGRPWDPNPDAVDEDCPTPYRDRLKVEFEASSEASLREVLDDAVAHFAESNPGDYSPAGRSLVFYGGDPDEGAQLFMPSTQTVTVTSDDGLAIWRVPPEKASLGELVLAEQRKVFKGDPLRPYVVVDPKWGMGGPSPWGWDNFIQVWDVLVYIVGSVGVVQYGVKLSKRGLELLGRATDSWQRHRRAAEFTRQMFENRGADIIDVIETAGAAAKYQLADIMAWTGIDNPAVAADVAGWAGYRLDEASDTMSRDPDEEFVSLSAYLPIGLSVDVGLAAEGEAEQIVKEALVARLHDLGLIEGDPPAEV